MPIINESRYRAPFFLNNGHQETVFPKIARKLNDFFNLWERVETVDNDFLDIYWSIIGNCKLAVLSHGLECNSNRQYVVGMVSMLNRQGWDAPARNYRG